MKLGRVILKSPYVVDLNNREMVDAAKIALYEDVMNAVKYNELHTWIDIIEDPDANEEDIPEFLIDEDE
jgi:hypothetical protein